MISTDKFRQPFARFAILLGTLLAVTLGTITSALAAQPTPWGTDLQAAATTVMAHIHWFENFTLIIITLIVIFVLGLMIYVCWRFSEGRNPTPSKTTHNTMIEVVWTVVPILILVVIAVPSFRLLYEEAVVPPADLTIKATGYQWYWGYEYPDHDDIDFLQFMLDDEERLARIEESGGTEADFPRLLAVDNEVVVPVDTTVRLIVTAADVLHAFALPAFGVKMDAVPGRLNETWFRAEREGIFYGQCSELCGTDHAFMPLAIRVVSQEQFDAWASVASDDLTEANEMLAQLLREADATEVAAN
ncbi:MAG: cytochrome c oxidase subunit II [Pseudomonadota bacterium]